MTAHHDVIATRPTPPTHIRIAALSVLGGVLLSLTASLVSLALDAAHPQQPDRASSTAPNLLIAGAILVLAYAFAVVMAWRMHHGSAAARSNLAVLASLDLTTKTARLSLATGGLDIPGIVVLALGIVADLVFYASAYRQASRGYLT